MRISKRQLRRIIREEKRRMREMHGDDHLEDVTLSAAPAAIAESDSPEGDLVVEMAVATRALEQVVESVQTAAQLCPDCVEEVASAGPLMQALTSQAEALQETLDAVGTVVAENAGLEGSVLSAAAPAPGDVADLAVLSPALGL